ncbi:MAG: cytochrome c3 family protein [Gemmatimonadota bacterium]
MRGNAGRLALFMAPIAALALASAGCVDEKIVFKERELFETPPPEAASFLGYSNEENKLTVCGNCHVGQQTKWVQTAHADAWAGLQDSGHAQAFCEGCHTVNELGNHIEGDVGYTSTGDARYHDVQCESCHGPGLGHVTNPDGGMVPLAAMDVGLDLTTGCGECHQGAHHPFVEEWSQSAHGAVPNQGYPGGREACAPCHTGEDALLSWGIDVVYEEKAAVENNSSQHLAITCAVCHDPHADKNDGQLRFPVTAPSEEANLCMKCHHKRGTPDVTTFRGPHSPEGPVLLGYGGWWPPNLGADGGSIVATHGSEANPTLCAGCHVNSYEVTDELGNFVQTATGHLFEAIPCLDANGVPTTGDCATTERTYSTCTGAGCHGSEAVARSLQLTAENRLDFLAEELDRLLSQIHPNWNSCRTNNSCGAGSPWQTGDGIYTTAEGAAFNYELALYPGSAIHNPFLLEALLTSTIRQVKTDYGVAVRAGVNLENILGK